MLHDITVGKGYFPSKRFDELELNSKFPATTIRLVKTKFGPSYVIDSDTFALFYRNDTARSQFQKRWRGAASRLSESSIYTTERNRRKLLFQWCDSVRIYIHLYDHKHIKKWINQTCEKDITLSKKIYSEIRFRNLWKIFSFQNLWKNFLFQKFTKKFFLSKIRFQKFSVFWNYFFFKNWIILFWNFFFEKRE